MKELERFAANIKQETLKKVKNPRVWKEKDVLDGRIVDSMVLILRTRGCSWAHTSGCLMCGYFRETYDAGPEELLRQVNEAHKVYAGEEVVKIFTSGSFLDEGEIPLKLQKAILERFSKAEKIIIESRPEYVANLEHLDPGTRIEVAMGLESAQDAVLEYAVNKGFSFSEWADAAQKVKEMGRELKVYILVKPPFLTEKDAIMDAVQSAEKVKDMADTVSFNPVAIHGKTVVEYLWKRKLYSPPWLWSVVEVLKKTAAFYDGLLKCDVVAGGRPRGSHNCGVCDKEFLQAIREFSLTQDVGVFKGLACACREEWLDVLETGKFFKG
ncbi:MAG: TIGR01210 family radical SAM protein [Thermoplasmata archaeon]|nr:MAG: TIGR01210 family radical SAM protein [Thermoplasmata archaeon]